MKKKKISTHYLEQFLSWLMEAMHPDLAQFEGLNLANRASVRQLVNGYLKPRFDELSPGEQFRVKESLRYGVAMWSEATLQNCFPQTNCTFALPRGITAREMYQQIWADLFHGEACDVGDLATYEALPYDDFVIKA